ERALQFQAAGIASDLQFAGASADLEEMLGNLLDNAGKWAQRDVTVTARVDEGQLRIDVRDDGPGLAAEALAQVTQRGVRLDERESSSGL
ncbi:ATP-binding protein, partial [Escherichia coli]